MRTRPYTAQFVGAPPHVPPFPPRRYPIYPIYGPGFGFGGCFGPFFFGCGGGFYGGGFMAASASAWATVTATAIHSGAARRASTAATITAATTAIRSTTTRPSDSSVSNEFNPSRYWGPSAPPEETGGGGGSASSSDNEVVLFLKDGTVYAITDYWIADNKLHYITNYGGENSIPLDQLDMQRTVDVNAKRGINITLRPSPQQQAAPAPDAQPTPDAAPQSAPAPNAPPAPPQSAPPY